MKESRSIVPDFDYYLNAFFNSARSVLWIMRAEYCKVEGWEQWFKEKDTIAEIEELIEKITAARNRSSKKEPLKRDTYMTIGGKDKFVDLTDYLKLFGGKEVTLEVKKIKSDDMTEDVEVNQKEGEVSVKGVLKIYDSIKEFKRQDICEVCQQYVNWLQKIVDECKEIFG